MCIFAVDLHPGIAAGTHMPDHLCPSWPLPVPSGESVDFPATPEVQTLLLPAEYRGRKIYTTGFIVFGYSHNLQARDAAREGKVFMKMGPICGIVSIHFSRSR
jgi:hypothetical protein